MKKENKISVLIIVAIIVAIAIRKRNWIKEKLQMISPSKSFKTETPTAEPVQQSINYVYCNKFPYKLGCKGKFVKSIQLALNKYYNTSLQVDGYFGPLTEIALKDNGFGNSLEYWEVPYLVLNKTF